MSANMPPARDGLWDHNPVNAQLLGLCPLLAISTTVGSALVLSIATLFVLLGSNLCISLLRHTIHPQLRIPFFVLIIASWVTIAQLLLQAFAWQLYETIGLFIALITTNCAIMGRAEAFAYRQPWLSAAADGLWQSLGFAWVILLLACIREALGHGSLGQDLDRLWGDEAQQWVWHFSPQFDGFLLTLLPAGAFIIFGLLLAVYQAINLHRKK